MTLSDIYSYLDTINEMKQLLERVNRVATKTGHSLQVDKFKCKPI